jgi:hypothetical protein
VGGARAAGSERERRRSVQLGEREREREMGEGRSVVRRQSVGGRRFTGFARKRETESWPRDGGAVEKGRFGKWGEIFWK